MNFFPLSFKYYEKDFDIKYDFMINMNYKISEDFNT